MSSPSVKVSVVVAVYNPGTDLDALVTSLLAQTMAAAEFEVIFVDDGSTDGSGERLDALASDHPTFRVTHIPNSGWPGRPRNVGIEAASGTYVFIVDHDDWLGDEALERMYTRAERNQADVVIGKEVGHGFGVPRRIFRHSIDDAKLGRDPLLALLTPHKLFRRSMLLDYDIRFPEGKRRLEDHHFVIQAYFHARRITVLADYPTYHWVKRSGGENATGHSFDRRAYYSNLRDILDIVDRHTEPGVDRDRFYSHWLRYKMIHKLLRPVFRKPGTNSRVLYDEVRTLMLERFPPSVDRHLPVGYRIVAAAVRADRLDLVIAAAQFAHGLRLGIGLRDRSVRGGTIDLALDCSFIDDAGAPLVLVRDGEMVRWVPPAKLIDGLDLQPDDLDCSDLMDSAELDVFVRQRRTALEYDRRVAIPVQEGPDRTVLLTGMTNVSIDVATVAAGEPLPDGRWDVLAQIEFGGWRASTRIPGPGGGLFALDVGADGQSVEFVPGTPPASGTTGQSKRIGKPGTVRGLAQGMRLLPVYRVAKRFARFLGR